MDPAQAPQPTNAPTARDFFVSYTRTDERWAEWIAWQLEQENYKCTLMAWDFRPSENFVLKMDEAAGKCRRTLAVLSPAYLESDFCKPEWAAAFALDPASKMGKLISVRVAECKPDGLLGQIIYIDLLGKNESAARQLLLAGVRAGRAKPAAAPAFPGTAAPSTPTRQGPAFPADLPPVWTVPFRPNPFFTGREDLLAELDRQLHQGRAIAITQPAVVHGLGGVGKTQLAAAYAWDKRASYDAVLWVSANTAESLEANLAALTRADALNLPEAAAKDLPVQTAAVLAYLRKNTRWLLVLDSADSPEAAAAIQQLLPPALSGHVLVTTRLTDWPVDYFPLPVPVLPLPAATKFLLDRTARASAPLGEPQDAERLATHLGCLPLALEQAAAYITRNVITFADYIALLEDLPGKVLGYKAAGATRYEKSVLDTWLITEQRLSPLPRTILRLAGFLAPDAIPRDLFTAHADLLHPAVTSLCQEMTLPAPAPAAPLDVQEALADLAAYSLVTLSPSAFSCHRLVQRVQCHRIPADFTRVWTEHALRLVNTHAPFEAEDVRTWPVWEPLRPHAERTAHMADEQEIAAPTGRLMNQLGLYLYSRALFRLAEPLYRRALAIAEKALGPDDPIVATDLNNLAQLLQDTNRLAEAEPLYRRALAVDEKTLGPDHPTVAIRLNNLATLLLATNRLDEAEPLIRRALAIDETALVPDHPTVAIRLNNLGQLLQATSRLAEAEPLMRRALAIDEKALGPDHPNVAIDLNNLAQFLQATNRQTETEPLLRRALAIDEKALGPDHPNVARNLNNLAQLLQDTNRLAEAEPLMRRVVVIFRKFQETTGYEHPNMQAGIGNYTHLLEQMGLSPAQVKQKLAEVLPTDDTTK